MLDSLSRPEVEAMIASVSNGIIRPFLALIQDAEKETRSIREEVDVLLVLDAERQKLLRKEIEAMNQKIGEYEARLADVEERVEL